jgi:glycosyltransferase involved in cell wall biosynthesis
VPWYLLRERPLLQRAAGLHLTSHQELRELRGRGLRPRRWILPNPLDLNALGVDPALRRQTRQQLGLATAEPLLLICGRLHHKKGLDLLPQALAPLADRPWRLLIVGADGDGSGRRLGAALERAGLGARVLWQPTRDAEDLAGIYNAADLLLLPSRHENFGNVVIEALACGAAVMVSDRTGVGGDLLAEAPAGCGQVLPRDPERWREALALWLRQPQRAGERGGAWAAARYGQAAVARQALGIYEEILHTWPQLDARSGGASRQWSSPSTRPATSPAACAPWPGVMNGSWWIPAVATAASGSPRTMGPGWWSINNRDGF